MREVLNPFKFDFGIGLTGQLNGLQFGLTQVKYHSSGLHTLILGGRSHDGCILRRCVERKKSNDDVQAEVLKWFHEITVFSFRVSVKCGIVFSMAPETGKWIFALGLVFVAVGAGVYFFHDKLGWIGRLPGDIRVEREGFRFYFPFTTLLILNAVIWVALRLYKELQK